MEQIERQDIQGAADQVDAGWRESVNAHGCIQQQKFIITEAGRIHGLNPGPDRQRVFTVHSLRCAFFAFAGEEKFHQADFGQLAQNVLNEAFRELAELSAHGVFDFC